MCLSGQEAFSFALQKAIGIEEAPLWPGKSRFCSGSLSLLVAAFERWEKRRGGRFSHVLLKYLFQSLVTNVKVICELKEGEVIAWWVGNVVASVAAPGYHRWEPSAALRRGRAAELS